MHVRNNAWKVRFLFFVPEEGALRRPLAEPEALLVAGDEELDVDEVAVVDGAHLRRRSEERHGGGEEAAVGEGAEGEGGDDEQEQRNGGRREGDHFHLGTVLLGTVWNGYELWPWDCFLHQFFSSSKELGLLTARAATRD